MIRVLLGCLLLGLVLYLTRSTTLPLAANWLDIGGRPERTDYVMILNGDVETRPFVAAALMRKGFADRALVAEVPQKEVAINAGWPTQNELVKTVLLHQGISDDRISSIQPAANNTFEEAHALSLYLKSHPGKTVTVITNNYHARRARWTVRRVLGAENSRVKYVTSPTNGFDQSNWWLFEEGLVLYVTEYCKLAFYFVRYGSLLTWGAGIFCLVGGAIGVRRKMNSWPVVAEVADAY